ncbi:SpoIIE family protein phosphatase [Streptacidiphilus anmyonensis]|uniref:SpoIIE family protein phosphatase n=1 Tax=Streptacidiphilus anmyonensis TaxID=405782 RepID=UPI0006940DB6|nr:SpoIIE family protein phosphatase [Streptacidiphilus anmyonensis]
MRRIFSVRTLAGRMFLTELLIVLLLVAAGVTAMVLQARSSTANDARRVTRGVAESFASAPGLPQELQSAHASTVLQPRAEAVRQATGVDSVVVFNTSFVQLTSPYPDYVGRPYQPPAYVQKDVLPKLFAGQTVTFQLNEPGFNSIATAVPVFDAAHKPLGAVVVNITVGRVNALVDSHLPVLLGGAAAAVLLAAAGTAYASRRLQRQTRGLGPTELTRMYEHHDAVLHAVREGVLIIGGDGRLIMVNDEARRLLDLPADAEQRPVAALGLDTATTALLTSPESEEITDGIHQAGDRLLAVNKRPTAPYGGLPGCVVTLRDTTELHDLTSRIEAAGERRQLLYEAGMRIGRTLDMTRTCDELAEVAIGGGFADTVTVDLVDAVTHGEEPPQDLGAATRLLRRTTFLGPPASAADADADSAAPGAHGGPARAGSAPDRPGPGGAEPGRAGGGGAHGTGDSVASAPGQPVAEGPRSAGVEPDSRAPGERGSAPGSPGSGGLISGGPELGGGEPRGVEPGSPPPGRPAAEGPGSGGLGPAGPGVGSSAPVGAAVTVAAGSPQARAATSDEAVPDAHHGTVTAPLRMRGGLLGLVEFRRAAGSLPFDADDLLLAQDLAARAAVSIDNARRYTREHGTAVALQRSLLPQSLPVRTGLDVAHRYLPASAGVGGDWFDVIPLPGFRSALVVGDVVGHGINAAVAMGRLRTAIRTFSALDLPPDEVLGRLDELVSQLDEESTDVNITGSTCVYAVYDPVAGVCTLSRAGHPGPAVLRPDGTVDYPEVAVAPPLGVGGYPFETTEIPLEPGSQLLLFSDGLVESRGQDIDHGLQGLRRVLEGRRPRTPEETCAALLGPASGPGAGLAARARDDVVLLVARTDLLPAEQVAEWDVPSDPAAVGPVRNACVKQLAEWGLEEISFSTELILSELITNAIRYGAPPVKVRLLRDTSLVCEVSDASSTAPHLRWAATTDEGGRGIFLVARLAHRWGTRYTPEGKVIWSEQPLTEGQSLDGLLAGFDEL